MPNTINAATTNDPSDPDRLPAVARRAAIYEQQEPNDKALVAYRDLMKNARDPELVDAASGRAAEIAAVIE